GGDKHVCRINIQPLVFLKHLIGSRIKSLDLLYFISKEMNSEGIICITRKDIHSVSLDPEVSMMEFSFGPGIKTLHQFVKQFGPGNYHIPLNGDDILLEFHRIPDPVKAGNRSYHKYIPSSRKQGRGGA